MANQPPLHVIRIGKVKAAIWANTTEFGTQCSVTFERLYRQDDAWKRSDSFGRDDLLVLAKVADLAHTWICEKSHQTGAVEPELTGGQGAFSQHPGYL